MSPLHAAMNSNNWEIFLKLLDNGADPINADIYLDWATHKRYPGNEKTVSGIIQRLKLNPKSLKHWCRQVIRSKLPHQNEKGGKLIQAIKQIELPTVLKEYLTVIFF